MQLTIMFLINQIIKSTSFLKNNILLLVEIAKHFHMSVTFLNIVS